MVVKHHLACSQSNIFRLTKIAPIPIPNLVVILNIGHWSFWLLFWKYSDFDVLSTETGVVCRMPMDHPCISVYSMKQPTKQEDEGIYTSWLPFKLSCLITVSWKYGYNWEQDTPRSWIMTLPRISLFIYSYVYIYIHTIYIYITYIHHAYIYNTQYIYNIGIHGGKPLERLITQQRPSWSKPGREILRSTDSSDTDDLGAGRRLDP